MAEAVTPTRKLTPRSQRLSVGWRKSGEAGSNSPLRVNNDVQEKRDRRLSRAAELQRNSLMESPLSSPGRAAGRPPAVLAAAGATSAAALDSSQLTELYTNCIKMCTDNKINQKNSWELNLIDYIQDVVEFRHGEMTNFQVASCTLDASVKIYSYRVDSIHQETYKVMSGLSRSSSRSAEPGAINDNDGDDDGDGVDDSAGGHKKKTGRSRHHASTLETKVENLNVKKFDLEFDVDPLFRKTSAAFDEGGARGLLLNHLYVQHRAELLFDSADAVGTQHSTASVAAPSLTLDLTSLQSLFPRQRGLEICPSLSNFQFMGWSPSAEGSAATTSSASLLPIGGAAQDTALNTSFGPVADRELSDDDEYFNAFDDDGHGDTDGGGGGDEYSQEEGAVSSSTVANLGLRTRGGVRLALATAQDEYNYIDPQHLKNWAGPNHWKAVAISSCDKPAPRKKAAKQRFTLDFSQLANLSTILATSR